MSRLTLPACLLLVLSARPARLAADGPSAKEVYGKALRSVGLVKTAGALATACLVDEHDRLLVTSQPIVGSLAFVDVVFPAYRDGTPIAEADYYLRSARRYRARVLDVSPRDGLALLQLQQMPAGLRGFKLAAASPGPGERVHAVGNPGANEPLWLYAAGTVRSVYQKKWTARHGGAALPLDTRVIETQAPVNAGDRGGPLLNDAGELVGVSLGAEADEMRVSRFVDVGQVRRFLADGRWLVLPLNADEFLERGRRHLDRGCLDAALADFNRAIKRNARSARAHCYRSAVFLARGDAVTALADAERAVRLDPNLGQAYFDRGRARLVGKDYDGAAADFTRVIQHDPNHAKAYNNRGVAYDRLGRLEDAVREYSAAIRVAPDMALAYGNRGQVRVDLKDYREAVADLGKALELGHSPVTMLMERGRAYYNLREFDEAFKDYSQACALEPSRAPAWLGVGLSLAGKGKRAEAVRAYDKAIALDGNFALAYFNRAAVFEGMDQIIRAHLDYETAVRLKPEYGQKAPPQDIRFLRVVNKSDKLVRVFLRYEAKTKEGGWYWYHTGAAERPVSFNIRPGQMANLFEDGWRVKARRVRLWAETLDGTGSWRTNERDSDIWLCQEPYRAQNIGVFTYTLNP